MTFTKAYGVENTEGEVLNMLGTDIRVLAGRRTGSSFSLMTCRLSLVKGLRRISMMTKMRPFTSSRVKCASRPALTNGCLAQVASFTCRGADTISPSWRASIPQRCWPCLAGPGLRTSSPSSRPSLQSPGGRRPWSCWTESACHMACGISRHDAKILGSGSAADRGEQLVDLEFEDRGEHKLKGVPGHGASTASLPETDSSTPDLGSTWVIWPHSAASSGLRSAAEAHSSLESSSQPG